MIKYIILPVLSILLLSCSAIDKLTNFDITYEDDFTLPSTSGIAAPIDIVTPEVDPNLQEKMKDYNSAVNLIEDVTIKSVKLTITTPDSLDYAFLEEIGLYIVDGPTESLLANKTDISTSIGRVLELETSDTDVLPYLLKDAFKLRIVGVMRDGTTVDIENDIEMIFTIDAKLL